MTIDKKKIKILAPIGRYNIGEIVENPSAILIKYATKGTIDMRGRKIAEFVMATEENISNQLHTQDRLQNINIISENAKLSKKAKKGDE